MAISFSPPLGKTAVVGVAPYSSTVELRFTATFASQQDYDEAKRDGVKVEIWTNIPAKHHSEEGWRAIAFQESTGESTGQLSLVQKVASSSKALHLHVSVPLIPGRDRFEFTHRLIYPSGKIKWLGKYACNGVLVFNRADPRFVQRKGLLYSHTWKGTVSPGPNGWDGEEIARLSPNFDWSICAVDNDASSRVYSLNDHTLPIHGSLLLFVPILRPQSFVVPQTFSLACTQGASISVDAQGIISITSPGEGSLFAQTYDGNADANMRKAAVQDSLTSCSLQNSYQLLDWDSGLGHAILTARDTITTKTISIIPFIATSSSPMREIRVRVKALASLIPTVTSQICLFSRPTLGSHFLAVPSEECEEAITILLDLQCSQFVVAPVYNLSLENGAWQAGVLTPHTLVTAGSASTSRPPTPPPSPPIQLQVTRPSRQQSRSPVQSSDESLTVIDVQQRVSEDAGLIFKSLAHQAPIGVSRYISYITSFAILLLKLLLLRILIYLSARRLPYEGYDDCMEDEGKGEDWEEVDDSRMSVWKDFSPLPEEDGLSVCTAADPDLEQETKRGQSLPLLLDVAAGSVSILLRSGMGDPSIKIELDGKQVGHSVLVLGEGTSLVEFDAEVGGRVSVLLL